MEQIEGRQPVMEWLKAGNPVNKLYVASPVKQGPLQKIIALAKQEKIPVQEVERQFLDNMSETRSHQGVIAQISAVSYWELADLLKSVKDRDKPPLFLVLDGIQDPHNLGSLIRTGEAAGISGVIIPSRRAVGVTATVAKTSAGALSYLPVCRVTNIAQTIEALKAEGIWVAGADMDGELCYNQDLTGPLAIVVGGEGKGVSRLVKLNCDFLIKLPMYGQVNSLNASIAGGLLIYEAVRQRTITS